MWKIIIYTFANPVWPGIILFFTDEPLVYLWLVLSILLFVLAIGYYYGKIVRLLRDENEDLYKTKGDEGY